MAVLLPNGKQSFIDSAGNPLVGGKVYTYSAGTNNPQITWADAAQVAANTNPITLDARGEATIFWLGTYKVKLTDALGNIIWTIDNIVAAPIDSTLRAELALATGSSLVGYNAGVIGAKDRTARDRLRDSVGLMDFYLATDPDLTAAFNRSVTYMNAIGGNRSVRIPANGALPVSGAVNPLTVPQSGWIGEPGSLIQLSYNGPAFTWGDKNVSGVPYGGGFENCQLVYPAAPGANAVMFLQNGAQSQSFRNLQPQNFRTLLQMGSSDGTAIGNAATLAGIKGFSYNGGSPCINRFTSAGLFMDDDCEIYVAGVPTPATDRVSTMLTLAGTSLVQDNGFTTDAAQISGFMERWANVYYCKTPGTGPVYLNVVTTPMFFGDYIRFNCVHLEALAGAGGIVGHRYYGYMNSWEGCTFSMTGAGVIRAINVFGINSAVSGQHGAIVNGANISDIHFWEGCTFSAPNRLNGGYSGVSLSNGSDFSALGVKSGYADAAGGFAWGAVNGIVVGDVAEIDKIKVNLCDASGTTKNYSLGATTHFSSNRDISNNLNADYAGNKTGTGIYVAPASGVPWVNTGYNRVIFCGRGISSLQWNGTSILFSDGVSPPVYPADSAGWGGAGPATINFIVQR